MDERPAGRIPAGPGPETRFTDLARFIEEDTTRRRLDRGPAWLLIITGIGCLLLGGLFYAAKYSGRNVTAEVLSVGPCSAGAATCTVEVGYHAGTRWVDAAITGVARMDIHGRPGHRTLYISYQPGAGDQPEQQ